MKLYADVIVNSDALDIDRPFTYEIPEEIIDYTKVGQWVKVPFGIKSKSMDGFILKIEEKDVSSMRIKKIKSIELKDPILTKDDIKLIDFIRDNYLCKYIDVIRLLLPQGILKGIKNKQKTVVCIGTKNIDENIYDKYKEIIDYVRLHNGKFNKAELTKNDFISTYKLNKLIKDNILYLESEVVYRYDKREFLKSDYKDLTIEQEEALNIIKNSKRDVFLLKGVTGSGKTEVYMNLVKENLKEDKSSIILVPEISLTPQMIQVFKSRFGPEVALFHSKLSDGERYDEWYRVKEGKAKVIIGARSALFLPAKNLGLIVIDEEHENSYKSEQNPRYHTREVAEFIGRLKNAKVILGSATPLIETYYRAISDEIKLIELNTRVNNKEMPPMEIVDMRLELKSGNMSMFSRKLLVEIKGALERKEQVILFLNRRGYSTFVSCRSCGYVFKCPHCDVSLTYHKNNFLVCHYCGFGKKQDKTCPKCSSKYVKFFGAGTEKVEDEIKKYFKEARVLRMDVDTTRNKHSYEKIYNSFKNNEADILIGTQMISKGLDFDNVTLVGVIAADSSLNLPDYKSSERTFQIITQVAGRAGRNEKEGKVIIQTYNPGHYTLLYSKDYDYEGFYREEFTARGLLNYPPFGKILLINALSKNEQSLIDFMKQTKEEILKLLKDRNNIDVLGPVPCVISKVKENFRWQIILKGELEIDLNKEIKEVIYNLNKSNYNEIRVSIDINPNNLI